MYDSLCKFTEGIEKVHSKGSTAKVWWADEIVWHPVKEGEYEDIYYILNKISVFMYSHILWNHINNRNDLQAFPTYFPSGMKARGEGKKEYLVAQGYGFWAVL